MALSALPGTPSTHTIAVHYFSYTLPYAICFSVWGGRTGNNATCCTSLVTARRQHSLPPFFRIPLPLIKITTFRISLSHRIAPTWTPTESSLTRCAFVIPPRPTPARLFSSPSFSLPRHCHLIVTLPSTSTNPQTQLIRRTRQPSCFLGTATPLAVVDTRIRTVCPGLALWEEIRAAYGRRHRRRLHR